jgi:hypothetical protein
MIYSPIHNLTIARSQQMDYSGIWMFAETSVYHLLSALNHLRLVLSGTL